MTKETRPASGMGVLIEEGVKLQQKNSKAAEILYDAAVNLAEKIGKRKKNLPNNS